MATAADISFLRTVILFQEVTEPDLHALWPWLREKRLRAGEVLFRDGDAGAEMFLVRSGTIVVSKPVTGRVEQVLSRIGPGDFFGEMSLFDRAPRSATIQAETSSLLLGLNGDDLDRLMQANPRAASVFFHRLVQVFIRRLRETTDLVAEVTRWGLESTGLDVEQSPAGER